VGASLIYLSRVAENESQIFIFRFVFVCCAGLFLMVIYFFKAVVPVICD